MHAQQTRKRLLAVEVAVDLELLGALEADGGVEDLVVGLEGTGDDGGTLGVDALNNEGLALDPGLALGLLAGDLVLPNQRLQYCTNLIEEICKGVR